jgi:hypothetical protein
MPHLFPVVIDKQVNQFIIFIVQTLLDRNFTKDYFNQGNQHKSLLNANLII